MISFASDYVAGAHPKVLNKLIETNMEILSGYGSDKYCLSAAEKIKKQAITVIKRENNVFITSHQTCGAPVLRRY